MLKLLKKIFSGSELAKTIEVDKTHASEAGNAKAEGNVLLAHGKLEAAATCYKKAVTLAPDDIEGHINLGYVFGELKRYREAELHLQQALRIAPKNVDSLFMLGKLSQEQGHVDTARQHFNQVLALDPDYEIAYRVLLSLDRHGEAVERCNAILRTNPDQVDVLVNRGIALQAMSRNNDASIDFHRALTLNPDSAELHFHYASTLNATGKPEEAARSYRSAISLNRNYADAHNNLGLVLLDLKRYDEALDNFDAAIGIRPDNADALGNRATALHYLHRYEDALESCGRALSLRPTSASTLLNYGVALKKLGRYEEAIQSYDRAIRLEPDMADAHFNASMCRLLLGDFDQAWEGHEWRWKTPQFVKAMRHFPQPLWLGKESLEGKTILLHAEQGLGDTIQFCRYAKQVAARGANVLLLVPDALTSLLAGLDGVSRVITDGDVLPSFDFHCPLLSLPLAFGTRLDTIDSTVPYLHVEAADSERWRTKLGPSSALRVGLVWSGNAHHLNDHNRSVPLALFDRLQSDTVQFVSLQKEVRPADLVTLQARQDIIHFGAALTNFTDTAALLSNLDVVISVDTSVAHLAAALGKPVWLLLPNTPDWRWMTLRTDSPWYPTMTLFRQSVAGDWTDVFANLLRKLNALLTESER